MARAIVDARDGLKRVTLVVEIAHLREVRLRIFIATHLIRLATWIAGIGLSEKSRIGVIVSLSDPHEEKPVAPSA